MSSENFGEVSLTSWQPVRRDWQRSFCALPSTTEARSSVIEATLVKPLELWQRIAEIYRKFGFFEHKTLRGNRQKKSFSLGFLNQSGPMEPLDDADSSKMPSTVACVSEDHPGMGRKTQTHTGSFGNRNSKWLPGFRPMILARSLDALSCCFAPPKIGFLNLNSETEFQVVFGALDGRHNSLCLIRPVRRALLSCVFCARFPNGHPIQKIRMIGKKTITNSPLVKT